MNPVTFNDSYLEMVKHHAVAPPKRQLDSILHSPLILWREDSNQDFEGWNSPEAKHDNGCPRLPFPNMRVDGFYRYLEDTGWMKFRSWLSLIGGETENPALIVILHIDDYQCQKGLIKNFPFLLMSFEFRRRQIGKPDHYKAAILQWCPRNKRFLTDDERLPLDGDAAWNFGIEWVVKLCLDFNNPHFHLCRVSPRSGAGRSVEWNQARIHYVLLHKSHPANRKESVGKKLITDGPTIDRAAHSRRAHFRLLRSPRYRNKQGQKIWVRSAWIGPEEWTDHSGQIYKIVERP